MGNSEELMDVRAMVKAGPLNTEMYGILKNCDFESIIKMSIKTSVL